MGVDIFCLVTPTQLTQTLSDGPHAAIALLYTKDDDPETGLALQFITPSDDPNNYLSPGIQFHPEITLGCFEVPAAGFSANNKMYVFLPQLTIRTLTVMM